MEAMALQQSEETLAAWIKRIHKMSEETEKSSEEKLAACLKRSEEKFAALIKRSEEKLAAWIKRIHKMSEETEKSSEEKLVACLKRKKSDEKRKESGENKISTFAEQTDDISFPYYSPRIKRRTSAWSFHRLGCFAGTGPENDQHTMQYMSGEKKKESGENKISTVAKQTDDIASQFYIPQIKIRTFAWSFRRSGCFLGTGPENDQHTMQTTSVARNMDIQAQMNYGISRYPIHRQPFIKSTFALCSQFLPFAGGSDLEDSQHKLQKVSGIYQRTLRTVSHCPSVSDYIQRATDKCAEVCTNNIQDGGCSYHCMRDSYKTSLVEFCAEPKILFDYCPEYDPIGRTIQKDIYTLCKASDPLQRVYSSSDLFFCDQGNCLQLRDAGVSTGVTSLMTDTTPVNGDLNESWLSQYWFMVLLGVALISCIVLGCIFRLRGRLLAVFRKWTKKGNPNDVQDENEQAVLHNAA